VAYRKFPIESRNRNSPINTAYYRDYQQSKNGYWTHMNLSTRVKASTLETVGPRSKVLASRYSAWSYIHKTLAIERLSRRRSYINTESLFCQG